MFDDEVLSTARQLVRSASEKGVTCGCAESCTAGLVSGAITAIAGSSVVLRGGIVSYDADIKHEVLGVSRKVIDDPSQGVVSEACARQMATGARRVLSCDIAVSVTGIAGPGGAEPGKPVGTVWFGLASAAGTKALCCHFEGDRDAVRRAAVLEALGLLYEATVDC